MTKPRKVSTIVASAGVAADPVYGGLIPPLFASDTFRWPDSDTRPDYDYSRTVNPNRDMLAAALAELEGAAGGVATNSGQSAALLALLLLPTGSLVVAPHDCYGGTYRLIKGFEEQGRLRSTFIDMLDDEAFDRAMAEDPALLWIETPSNPLLRITDIADRAARAKRAGALVIADNTLPTPCRQRPLALGCDLVMHSTTKALNGHGDLFGGALLAADAGLVEKIQWWANAAGLSASAHDSWQTLRGLRTLPLRVERQEATAQRIAEWLAAQDRVAAVHYPGLSTHPGHELAERQQQGPGFMISFRVKGGDEAAAAFLSGLDLITLASSLGGFATLICKPSTMTHGGMPPKVQKEAGIYPDLLRLSIGLEDADDLIADLARGFGSA
ncbi:trans-sulfuration enzyme family protein [Sphingosinicella humi]|uniref:O-succinylhomoserine (Thiol)-lyase n=1 Tax=Allosphingosinicella humi TaxID=2068657 RepID=A0A2U2IZV2_9SPHN|nr:PLP-dependent transferase [Sphingosinicella humi]PWG01609.1 O-succinylhomoserine (thiol)-lyase [Sphingosinicella humi]